MKPYTDEEAGKQLILYGTTFVMVRLIDGKQELFLLDREEVILKELQDE